MIAQFKQTAEAAVVKSNSADVNKLSKKHAHYESSMTNNNDANDDMKRKKRTFRKISGMPLVRHVYVVCPGGTQTGGPEALHQLCDMINSIREYKDECAEHQHSPLQAKSISVRCFMLYMQEQRGHGDSKKLCHVHDKMPATYHAYNCPSATHIPYNDTDLVVWPECWTNYIDDFEGPQPAIWWLSVDNNRGIFQDFSQRIDVRHFCQSTYSRNYLLRNGVSDNQMMTLTEYISLTRFPKEEVLHLTSTLREVDVVYNPIKGMHYTDEVIARAVAAKGRNFIIKPIGGGPKSKRMTPKEVRSDVD